MNAVASRRQLHAVLLRLRVEAGLTQTAVARGHDWSPSKVHRIEKGLVSVSKPDLLALLDDYGLTDAAERAHLVELARLSRRRTMPFAQYRDVFAPEVIRFFGYESTASWIGEVELLVVPGLLQLPEYTRALIRDGHGVTGPMLDRIVESRRERQRILDGDNPPAMSFVVDEAVLTRAIGGGAVLARQLAHLSDVARRPHVSIRVLPLSLGAHAGLRGSFTYLRFADENDPDVVYMENRRGDSIFEHDDEVTSTTFTLFGALEQQASRPQDFDRYAEFGHRA